MVARIVWITAHKPTHVIESLLHEWALKSPVSTASIIYSLSHPAKTFRWLVRRRPLRGVRASPGAGHSAFHIEYVRAQEETRATSAVATSSQRSLSGLKVGGNRGLLVAEDDKQLLTNGSLFASCKSSEFLDSSCHQNVSTRLDFAHIETEYMFIFGPRKQFSKNLSGVNVLIQWTM